MMNDHNLKGETAMPQIHRCVGVIVLNYNDFISFRRTGVFNAINEEDAYSQLHDILDRNMDDEAQSHILNDWVIDLDDNYQVSLPDGKETRELSDTYENMTSSDYVKRFKAEYDQLSIRYNKLKWMLENWDDLDFEPSSPKDLLEKQLESMSEYRNSLRARAEAEGINI